MDNVSRAVILGQWSTTGRNGQRGTVVSSDASPGSASTIWQTPLSHPSRTSTRIGIDHNPFASVSSASLSAVSCRFAEPGFTMADSKTCTIRTRKFLTNQLLQRKQFVRCLSRSPSASTSAQNDDALLIHSHQRPHQKMRRRIYLRPASRRIVAPLSPPRMAIPC